MYLFMYGKQMVYGRMVRALEGNIWEVVTENLGGGLCG